MPANSQYTEYVGYVEDAEEGDGSSVGGIEGTRRYAYSEANKSPERPNTGKARGERRKIITHSDVESDSDASLTDSDETPRSAKQQDRTRPLEPRRSSHKDRERHRDRESEREREQRRREKKRREEEEYRRAARADAKAKEARTLKKTRPAAPKHAATQPVVSQGAYRRGTIDDPAAYGVQQPAASGSRPRAQTRPASYYAGQQSRPPPVDMGWNGPPPVSFPVGSYPPPPHMFPGPGGPPMSRHGMPPPSPITMSPMAIGPPSFFEGPMGPPPSGDNLRHRFDKRPSSAMGFNSPPSGISYMPDEYDEEPVPQVRRPSRSKKVEDDRKKMPPPDFLPKRTQSARPTTGAFKAPPTQRERPPSRQNHQRPPTSHRRSVGFVDQQAYEDDDFLGEVDLFHDVSPNQRRTALTRTRRSSVAYDHHGLDIVPAKSRNRRSSMYGSTALESGGVSLEEDKYLDALRYQEDVSGGAPVPLTAESLRKASKRGDLASSRSTRSSGSRDESEYKRSNTTGITQSSSGNDDFTIKVSGQAVVRFPGAEIECDGGQITFSRPPGASRAGSDRESTVYQLEDARASRMERKALPHRPRAPSQSDSQSRGYPALHAPYEYAPYDAPHEQITYEHAPYDPSLAASNFY